MTYQSKAHTFKNVWATVTEKEHGQIFDFNEGYKAFIDKSKTERLAAREIVRRVEEKGYVAIESLIKAGKALKAGQKVYGFTKDKAVILFVIGKENISKGLRVVGGHIDSPRIDIKPFPLYEEAELGYLKTHYYGGVKKYQWASQPLALHGRVIKANGEAVDISIGENADDPVFVINDLLPHLAKDQMNKKMGEGITGEGLNILIGSIPVADKDAKEKIKEALLQHLAREYDIAEADFVSAEIEAVPAGKARDVGFDRSLILAYGQDDRACAYTTLEAILQVDKPTYTAVGMFMDKEEVGSNGNSGSESAYLEYCLAELIALQENYSDLLLRRCMHNTKVLSADVAVAFDPNFASVMEKQNSAYIGKGVCIVKYTGSRGKGGCNDANAEFVGEVRQVFEKAGVIWQTGELGKVDQGGGGTIAYILANKGAEVVDCGIPVLSMHAPYEVASKADVYMAYKAYLAFYQS